MVEGTMEANLAAEFWTAVEDCLVRFHAIDIHLAREKTQSLWQRLRQTAQPEAYRDMIYHEEPWYIACRLAGREDAPPEPENAAPYKAILRRHHLAPIDRRNR